VSSRNRYQKSVKGVINRLIRIMVMRGFLRITRQPRLDESRRADISDRIYSALAKLRRPHIFRVVFRMSSAI